jgi:16S rRNA (guanine527-N7)-methyltransferase
VDNPGFERLCQAYAEHVSYWNTITNLISTGNVDNLLTDLIVQSIKPLEKESFPQGAKLLDVGSGAGIPALPLKFARPDFRVILLEPRRKKISFLRRVIDELGLKEIEVVSARLEDVKDRPDWQGKFDLITTRGTGHSPPLFRSMEPLVKPGGSIWFYKGLKAQREAAELSQMTSKNVSLLKIDRNLSVISVNF